MRTLLVLSLLLLAASTAVTQPEPDSAWLAFDAGGNALCQYFPGFVVFHVYLLAYPASDISAWEMGINISDPNYTILSTTFNPPEALNVGSVGNFVVDLGVCLASAERLTSLMTYSLGYFVHPTPPSDVRVCLGPSDPSSVPAAPGYASCADEWIPFEQAARGLGGYPDGCVVINPLYYWFCPVGTADESWGALKARF